LTLEQAMAEAKQVRVRESASAPVEGAMEASADAAKPAGLADREAEVLRLVAHGLTSAQVAEQLVISRLTVNTHLRNIYAKIGVNTRAGAARWAVEHSLV
jgi:DNA-binding CsgD family transcriptional regulator